MDLTDEQPQLYFMYANILPDDPCFNVGEENKKK
jgi:hypothetical protein